MFQLPTSILWFSLLASLALQVPPTAEEQAWTAALTLKQKSPNLEAAAALAKFRADYPQSTHAVACSVEEGICWFSSGRSAQVLHRATPEAQERFDKALALFKNVTTEHATAPEAPRACYMQGSTHFFQGQLEFAEADFSTVLDKFAADKNYVGKALGQRASVRRQLLRPKDALADLQRWVKEIGAPPDLLEKSNTEIARARMLDKPAPIYRAESWFNGEPAPLELQSGSVVALYFFATWCPNCAAELPFVLDLEQRIAPRGVRFIGIVDHSQCQTPEVVKQYLATKQIAFSVLQDNGEAAAMYKATTIPMLVLIDRSGNLRWCDKPSVLADWTIENLVNEGLEPPKKRESK